MQEKGKRSILIVDDEQLYRFLVELFKAKKLGVIVESALDGFEAGSKVHQAQPDVVLLDLMMPGMDGFQVCERLKSGIDTMHIEVIAMSGHYSEENEEKIMEAGADKLLRKPFSNREVLDACGFINRDLGVPRP